MMRRLFTIGHSLLSIDEFVARLRQHGIDSVVDVRSVPFSRYVPQFNADVLSLRLRQHGIAYLPMGAEFGARPTDPSLYAPGHRVSFESLAGSAPFLAGVERVEGGMDRGRKPVLMCSEKDPADCHRAILVARAFVTRGTDVTHILADGTGEPHICLDKRLLDRFFPNRHQLSLWDTAHSDDVALLQAAYTRRGRELAYEIESTATGGENKLMAAIFPV